MFKFIFCETTKGYNLVFDKAIIAFNDKIWYFIKLSYATLG